MNCPQCKNDMILAQATNFGDKYHYCRSCKKELKEMRWELPNKISFTPTLAKEIDLPDLEPVDIQHYTGYINQMIAAAPPLEDLDAGSVVLAMLVSMQEAMDKVVLDCFVSTADSDALDRMSTDCDWIHNWQVDPFFGKHMEEIKAEMERQMAMPPGHFLMGEWK